MACGGSLASAARKRSRSWRARSTSAESGSFDCSDSGWWERSEEVELVEGERLGDPEES